MVSLRLARTVPPAFPSLFSWRSWGGYKTPIGTLVPRCPLHFRTWPEDEQEAVIKPMIIKIAMNLRMVGVFNLITVYL